MLRTKIADPDEIVYRMPRKYRVYLALGLSMPQVAVGVYGAWLFAPIDLRLAATVLAGPVVVAGALVLVERFIPTVTIVADHQGLRWSRWHLRWEEVRAARVRSMLGLRWVVIHRQHGLRWSVSWSLPGSPDFIPQIVRLAPKGNPLRECVETHVSQRSPA